jgi:hypothetical protein
VNQPEAATTSSIINTPSLPSAATPPAALENLHVKVFNKLKGKGLGMLEGLELPEEKFQIAKAEYMLMIDQVSNEIVRAVKQLA